MSTTVTVDGNNYEVPENAERGWGTEVSNLLIALAGSSLLIKGGSIPLTSEADFGTNFGLKAPYFKTATADPASAGVVRLATTDAFSWRNAANSSDLSVGLSSDRMQFAGSDVVLSDSTDILTNKTYDAAGTGNALSNVDTTMLSSGTLITSTVLAGAADTNFPSTLAIKTYVDDAIADIDDASEISYTPTTPGDWPDPDPATVLAALDQLAAERALSSDLTSHTSATSAHGVTGDIAGTGGAQTFTDKTLTSPVINTQLTGTAVESDLSASASATKVPSASAAKAYSDSLEPTTTRGDIAYRDASNTLNRLPVGTLNQVLTSDGTDVSWATPSSGFADPMTTRGDLIFRNPSNVTTRIGSGSDGQILRPDSSGDLAWENGLVTSSKAGMTPAISNGTSGASSGDIGEYIEDQEDLDAITMSNETWTDICSITLTAGDWDISWTGIIKSRNNAGLKSLRMGVGTTSAASPGTVDCVRHQLRENGATSGNIGGSLTIVPIPGATYRQLVTTTTTYYLVGFAGSAPSEFYGGGGILCARRVR